MQMYISNIYHPRKKCFIYTIQADTQYFDKTIPIRNAKISIVMHIAAYFALLLGLMILFTCFVVGKCLPKKNGSAVTNTFPLFATVHLFMYSSFASNRKSSVLSIVSRYVITTGST